MKSRWILCVALSALAPVFAQPPAIHDYPVRPVAFTAVHVNDVFWAPKIETNRKITIPFAFHKDEETGRIDNFERAAKALRGETFENHKYPPYPFDDTDVYKVIEGAAYTLSVHPDAQLEAYVDGLIVKIAAAQEPDGYLYTARTIDPLHPHPWSGTELAATALHHGLRSSRATSPISNWRKSRSSTHGWLNSPVKFHAVCRQRLIVS